MWLVVGWIFTFLSVEAPILYLIPIAFVLVMPVIRRRQRAVRYKDRWSWFTILVAALVAVALVYGSYLVLKWLAPLFLPLAGQLLLMSGFSLVMAAAIALVIAWLTGMINALRARSKPVPIFGRWGDRLFARLVS